MTYDPYQRYPQQAPAPAPYSPTQAYEQASYAPQPPGKRASRWPYVVLVAAVLFAAGGAWTAYDRGLILKDPGIAACESMRAAGKLEGAPVDSKADGKMTEAQYLKLRQVFKDSRHDDLAQAGTTLIDVMWQVTQLGPDPGMEALPYMGQMMSAVTAFQGACANHGIVVNIAKNSQVGK